MNRPHSTAAKFLRGLVIFSALLIVQPAWAQPNTRPAQASVARQSRAATRPAAGPQAATGNQSKPDGKAGDKAMKEQGADKWLAEGISKGEWKAKKRERQRQQMLEQIKKRGEGTATTKATATSKPNDATNPYQLAEDFDRNLDWEQKDNRGIHPSTDYGYSNTRNLASAGCAPGEIGGTVGGSGISWFADNVGRQPVPLDVDFPLTASGWFTFTATAGNVAVGWFNSTTYAAPDVVADNFIGWRQDGDSIRASLGSTGSSFVDGTPMPIPNGKPFQWTLSYTPTGGANACGQITLTIGASSSTLALTKEQRDALDANGFDRFGIVTGKTGTQASTLWLDNLVYTRISGFPLPHPEALAHTRTAFFDTDPTGTTFFGVNNLTPHEPVTVIQDYGYRPTGGRTGGCIGGRFNQCIGTSYYGYDYGEKKLHFTDKLRSEGWFQVPKYEGDVVHIGWTTKKAKSWHEPSTLSIKITVAKGGMIGVHGEGTLGNYEGHGGAGWGTVATLSPGPQWHHYMMEFDPAGGYGLGTFTVQIDDTSKVFYFGEGKLAKGANIDLFGMWNGKIPAEERTLTVYLDDVINTVNGNPDAASNDFNSSPAGWVGCNNSFTAKDYVVRPNHEFGWAKTLPHLDGLNGFSPMYTIADPDRYCMGGIIHLASFFNTNVPRASYGAGLNGTLNARDHHMFATGRFKIDWATVDAGELFGWYNSATACDNTTGGKGHMLPDKFLGVSIQAGSNGYGMIPGYRSPNQAEEQMLQTKEPAVRVYEDGEWREFYMEYDPDAAGGKGQFKLQIGADGAPVTFDLKDGAKGKNGDFAFDRFGLLTARKGGGKPHAIYFDKLTYTVAP